MEKFPLPSYSSAVSSIPRLGGDGMDSDSLKPNNPIKLSSTPPNLPPPRHRNLNSSSRAATIAKTQKPKHVPKEPTKGAVGHLKPRTSNHFTQGPERSEPSPRSNLNGAVSPNTVGLSTNRLLFANKQTNQPGKQNIAPAEDALRQVHADVISQKTGTHAETMDVKIEMSGLKVGGDDSSYVGVPVKEGQSNKGLPKHQDTRITMAASAPGTVATAKSPLLPLPPTEEREVEGQSSQPVSDVKLQAQVDLLKRELEQQVKINSDLKKLLVASVGDDLHWKMDALIQTKTQLASEIGGYTEKMRKDYEELDTLSIQADMWRSKFMATRVLIDQLSTDKDKLLNKNLEAERALKHLMQERQELQSSMLETHRYLKFLRDSFDPIHAHRMQSLVPNILELARTNLLLSEAIKLKLLGNMPLLTVALDAGIQNGLTPAEKMAYQVLMSDMEIPHKVPSHLASQHISHFGRFHPYVKEEGFHWTCCRNCTGDIYVV